MANSNLEQQLKDLGDKIVEILSDGKFHSSNGPLGSILKEVEDLTMSYLTSYLLLKSLLSTGILRPKDGKGYFRLEYKLEGSEVIETVNLYSCIIDRHIHVDSGDVIRSSCKWFSGMDILRCAVNPLGPCKGCSLYESGDLTSFRLQWYENYEDEPEAMREALKAEVAEIEDRKAESELLAAVFGIDDPDEI